ncbi:hypothetical protein MNBD_GAMMA22-2685 [hydrothermal vent metagenome]|uniref:Uncharacterized protein n=1 Tax=hydrothermal vent metagenome TaxID=652676 RepID=A0A3B0ZT69_9ZZZZ
MEYLELTRINGCEESLLLDNCRPFKIITEKLSIDSKKVILDLGPASNNNLDFFSKYYCKIFIEDFFASILNAEKDKKIDVEADEAEPDYDSMLYCDATKNEKIDIIFCWELLNYIPREFLRCFIKTLLKVSKKDTLFHAFIATQATMADTPLEYTIKTSLTMERTTTSAERIKAPRYNQLQLFKFMPELKVIKSILHRNGMQEYLLCVK